MADKMMRIAGRTNAGTAVHMAADANGNIVTVRKWKKDWIALTPTPLEIRDTTPIFLDAYDVSEFPTLSLRVLNRLRVPITLSFRSDVNATNNYALVNKDDVGYSVTVAPTDSYVVITPDDVPILNYIRLVKITIKMQSAPTEGDLQIYLVPLR